MTFELVVKLGQQELARVKGRTIPHKDIDTNDLMSVIPTEQYLERLFGLRFHIQQVQDTDNG